MKNAIEHADYVFCNEDECDAYGKMVGIEESNRDETAKKLASQPKTNKKRPRTVIITQGSEPMIVATATAEGDVTIEHVPCEKIPKE